MTTKSLRETVDYLLASENRLGMYFGPAPHYIKLSLFIEGCDYVLNGALLKGLKEMLKNSNTPQNLAWFRSFQIDIEACIEMEAYSWTEEQRDQRACQELLKAIAKTCRA